MSQEELAEKRSLSYSTISLIESSSSYPRLLIVLSRIAQASDVEPYRLLKLGQVWRLQTEEHSSSFLEDVQMLSYKMIDTGKLDVRKSRDNNFCIRRSD